MRMLHATIPVLALAAAACGTTPEERGISGAGLGAAGGAIIGAVTGLTVVEAALIGTGVGGVTGLLTDRSQINLGEPFWKWGKSSRQQAAAPRAAAPASVPAFARNRTVTDVQAELARLGYDPGPTDGVAGPRTSTAIRTYQKDHGLLVDGRASPELLAHIRQTAGLDSRFAAQ